MGVNKMAVFVACFVLSVLFFGAGLYFFQNQESTAFHKTLALIDKVGVEIKSVETLVTSNISTVGNANVRIGLLEDSVKKMRDELDVFRDQVADTREKQIKLRDALSRKRPQLTFSSPVPVELINNAKLKTPVKEVKKLKEQIKELSK
jgi:hypothetical protein